ncbi:MAG: hypothetical protein HY791_02420 [Deltaproteobacteria bacterium]|nr:hypothetical protein [Deltaproteobacteria bacterium]
MGSRRAKPTNIKAKATTIGAAIAIAESLNRLAIPTTKTVIGVETPKDMTMNQQMLIIRVRDACLGQTGSRTLGENAQARPISQRKTIA